MISKTNKYQKIISFILVISILMPSVMFFSLPKKAEAQWVVTDPGNQIVNTTTSITTVKQLVVEILKQMLMMTVRKLLNQMTQNTINWINRGFHGNPFYLENPDSFFKDIAKYEIRNLVDLFAYDSLKYPFGKSFAQNTINIYQRQLADNAAYSLSGAINDPVYLNNFRNDFNVGGWNGFLINTQYPQNNYVGFQLLASQELLHKLRGTGQNAAQKTQTALQQGMGFLSPKMCPTTSNPNYNNGKNEFLQPRWNEAEYRKNNPYEPPNYEANTPEEIEALQELIAQYRKEWEAGLAKARGEWAKTNECPGGLVATTPGSVVANQIMTAITSKTRQGELGAALGNSLSAIFDALINKFLNKGLSALTNLNYTGEGEGGFNTSFLNDPDAKKFGDSFLGTTNDLSTVYGDNIANGGYGQTCTPTGTGNYEGAVRDAENTVLAANPDLAASLNTEENSRELMALVEAELQTRGFNATDEVLNGNDNPNRGDLIAVWMEGDERMERYDAVISVGGSDRTMAEAATAQFVGLVAFNCTASGGGKGCKDQCKEDEAKPEECLPPKVIENNICVDPTTTGTGVAKIDSIGPTTATAGATTLTINGTNLTNQVSFYDANGQRNTVVGTVNEEKTQTTVLVPADQPGGPTTVKIYQGGEAWSNGMLIVVEGQTQATVTSYDATGGWGGNLAFNPNQNNWLVVSGGVNGRIMGNDGTAVTSEFQLQKTASTVQVMAPKVAFASDINKYLVVWIGFPDSSGGTIYGRFVNPDGSMSGEPFIIFKDPAGGASFFSKNSVLQYDSENEQFAFVWEYRHGGLVDSNLITISQSGTPGEPIDIGTDAGSWSPVMAINEHADEYCLAYVRSDGVTNVVRKYDVSTGTLGAETTLDSNSFGVTGIVYNSVNKKYMITWPTKSTATTSGKILNTCNINDGGSILTINSVGRGAALSYNPKSNNYAVIVQNQNDAGNTYNILSSFGNQLSTGVAFTGGYGNFSPVIAANTNDGSFAATSSKEYAITRFAPGLSGTATGTIIPATPVSTWSPAHNNGWWGKLSSSGRYVTYGNFGGNYVTDLFTQQTWNFSTPAGAGITTGAGCRAGEWISSTKLTFLCELTDNGPMSRYEVTIGEWVPRLTSDDPSLVQATMFRARDGHWASYLASNPTRVVKDNAILATNTGGALSMSGSVLVNACDNSDNPNICVWNGTNLSKTIVPKSPVSETSTQGSYILYAGASKVRGVDSSGNDIDKKIGTFNFEGKPVAFLVRGAVWIATSVESYTTNKSYVILRPWSSKSAIVVDTGTPDSGSVSIDVVFDGTNFVVAQHTNKGILKVIKVSENATRSQF